MPAYVAVAVTSSAPAVDELAGDKITAALPVASVSAVLILVFARPRTTVNVTTSPATPCPLPSVKVAVTVAGVAELILLEDNEVESTGDAAKIDVDT